MESKFTEPTKKVVDAAKDQKVQDTKAEMAANRSTPASKGPTPG